jgi:hypothetical protein
MPPVKGKLWSGIGNFGNVPAFIDEVYIEKASLVNKKPII